MLGDKPYFFGSNPHTLGRTKSSCEIWWHGTKTDHVLHFRLRGIRSFGAVRIHSDGFPAADLHESQLREPLEILGQDARQSVAGLGGNVHQVRTAHQRIMGNENYHLRRTFRDCMVGNLGKDKSSFDSIFQ